MHLLRNRTLTSKAILAAVANRIRLFDVYASLKRKHIGSQVVIANYHRVTMIKDDWSCESLSPQAFESQIEYFRQNFEILSLDQLSRHLRQDRSLPKKAVVVTFDDGYLDNYVYARPILRKYGVPATFFLTTGHIGGSRLFWWDKVGYAVEHTRKQWLELTEFGTWELPAYDRRKTRNRIVNAIRDLPEQRKNLAIEDLLRVAGVSIPDALAKEVILSWEEVVEMSEEGIDFGAHTLTHPILTNMPLEQAKLEIVQSKKDIETKIGRQVNFFSYPNGSLNSEIVDIVKQAGFVAGVTADPSWITQESDVYRLGRIMMIGDSNRSAVLLCGLWGDLGVLRRL
jgi:peptidoglycan/xylan/chitin deacetylase (PgdA/CDA1 family)